LEAFVNNQFLRSQLRSLAKRLAQSFLTFIRGVANEGEQPIFRVNSWCYLAVALLELAISVLGAHLILNQNNPWLYSLLILTFMSGQAGAWTIYMTACHHGVHGAFSRIRWVNAIAAELASVVIFTPGRDRYRKTHNGNHHPPDRLASEQDDDYLWLKSLGFVGEQPISYYWRCFWLTLISPRFYWDHFLSRFRWNFISVPMYRRCIAVLWWMMVLTLTAYANAWGTLLLGYLLPVIFGYTISSYVQNVTEHRWLSTGDPSLKTFPRLLPVEVPQKLNFWDWLSFTGLLLVYMYWKLAILPTDLQQHQIHHRLPHNYDWPLIAYSPAALADRGDAILGIRNHFREAFRSLSEAQSHTDDLSQ
jgi:fatty acid desaturase